MQLHEYQKKGVEHILKNDSVGLFMDMGLGKTLTTLTAIDKLIYEEFKARKVLVIAPKKVAQATWKDEIEKWEHLRHLKISIVVGTERQRLEALNSKADIYAINRENVTWLVSLYQSKFPFDVVVIDELSSFKSADSKRFKSLRRVRPLIDRVIGLTGTPAPNGYMDLWSQLYLLDQGERLGKTLTAYREAFFNADKRRGPIVYNYKIKKGQGDEIKSRIGDICMYMDSKDYLNLPERIDINRWINLSPEKLDAYKAFEREMVLELLDSGVEISAVNSAAILTKLRQFANGAIYDEDGNWHHVHDEKLDQLEEDIEATLGEPVLVFYQFRHDLERILKRINGAELLSTPDHIKRWNEGKIKVLVAHAASAGHGLNLQHGGHYMEWFGLDYALELYLQGIHRLDRQGQKNKVINTRLLTRGTVDEVILQALESKDQSQNTLLNALKLVIDRVKGESV